MPSEQELQAIDKYLEPPVTASNDNNNIAVEELTDYFKNKIYDSDGVFLVHSVNVVYLGSMRVRTTVQASEILTHDSIVDYLEDEIDTYSTIEYLGTGEKYKKEVYGE